MRGMRTIPVVLDIVRDMEELCPDAWFLNYTNPMSILVRAVAEASPVRAVGLCHSVFWTIDTLAGYVGVPRDEVDHVSAGVNHLAFLLRLEHRGRDLYPDLRAFVASGAVPGDDLVRAELFRHLGLYPTESSEHHAEYSPWFIPKGDGVERFRIPIGEYLARVAHNLEEYDETKRRLDAGAPFEIEQSGEYAAVIVHSLLTGEPARIVANVMNAGGLIHNLPEDACVEVPCTADGDGIRPHPVGALPPHLAALDRAYLAVGELTVRAYLEGRRDWVYHACALDPGVVGQGVSLERIWAACDELFEAHGELVPAEVRAA
jgi:alpha-galactosidase